MRLVQIGDVFVNPEKVLSVYTRIISNAGCPEQKCTVVKVGSDIEDYIATKESIENVVQRLKRG